MCFDHLGLLAHQYLTDGAVDVLVLKCLFICFLSGILTLLSSRQQSMVAATQMGFQVTPCPMNGSGDGPTDVI